MGRTVDFSKKTSFYFFLTSELISHLNFRFLLYQFSTLLLQSLKFPLQFGYLSLFGDFPSTILRFPYFLARFGASRHSNWYTTSKFSEIRVRFGVKAEAAPWWQQWWCHCIRDKTGLFCLEGTQCSGLVPWCFPHKVLIETAALSFLSFLGKFHMMMIRRRSWSQRTGIHYRNWLLRVDLR